MTDDYWGRSDLKDRILETLQDTGADLDALTIQDLAPLDQFHGGGMEATRQLARSAGFTAGQRVLDVGGGLGGPARTLAVEFGCDVTVVDLTESYVEAAKELTARLGLEEQVRHQVCDALELPFDDATFDAVWTQNSGMNISDKERLYAGFHRVLKPGGMLALQEPLAGPVQPIIFPVMWAADASTSFLRTAEKLRSVIEEAGFRQREWMDLQPANVKRETSGPTTGIQQLVMGDSLAAIREALDRNREEDRTGLAQAIFDKA